MFLLASELQNANKLEVTAGADKTKGLVEDVNGLIGFWFSDVANGSKGTFIVGGIGLWEVDCDNTLAYSAGEAVYEDSASIDGSVNKTSGGTNVVVGYAAKDYPIGTAKILIVPKGV